MKTDMKKITFAAIAFLCLLSCTFAADPLKGKKIGFLGDSYVRNHREPVENTWHYKFAQKHQMEYYNYGRNGNCIALDLKQWGTGMYKRYTEMNDSLDYIIVIAGHNDASQGRLDSIGIDTFKSRLTALCEGLIEKYPNGQIIFFTPWTCENFEGSPRQRVVDSMIEVCGAHGIPIFDAARQSGIYAASESFRKIYFQGGHGTDRAHLNARGHDRFLPVAEQFIMRYVVPEAALSHGTCNVLEGKKWVACGDSFTHGDFKGGEFENWPDDYKSSDRYYDKEWKTWNTYPWWIARRNAMTIGWGGIGTLWGRTSMTVYVAEKRYTKEFMDNSEYFTVMSFDVKVPKNMYSNFPPGLHTMYIGEVVNA